MYLEVRRFFRQNFDSQSFWKEIPLIHLVQLSRLAVQYNTIEIKTKFQFII